MNPRLDKNPTSFHVFKYGDSPPPVDKNDVRINGNSGLAYGAAFYVYGKKKVEVEAGDGADASESKYINITI